MPRNSLIKGERAVHLVPTPCVTNARDSAFTDESSRKPRGPRSEGNRHRSEDLRTDAGGNTRARTGVLRCLALAHFECSKSGKSVEETSKNLTYEQSVTRSSNTGQPFDSCDVADRIQTRCSYAEKKALRTTSQPLANLGRCNETRCNRPNE